MTLSRSSLSLQARLSSLSNSLQARFKSVDRKSVYEAAEASLSICINREDILASAVRHLGTSHLREHARDCATLNYSCAMPHIFPHTKQVECPSTFSCREATGSSSRSGAQRSRAAIMVACAVLRLCSLPRSSSAKKMVTSASASPTMVSTAGSYRLTPVAAR